MSIDFPQRGITPNGFTIGGGAGVGAEVGTLIHTRDQYLYNFQAVDNLGEPCAWVSRMFTQMLSRASDFMAAPTTGFRASRPLQLLITPVSSHHGCDKSRQKPIRIERAAANLPVALAAWPPQKNIGAATDRVPNSLLNTAV